MNNTGLKLFSIAIIILIFIYAFSVSATSDSIDNISYVIALAVDLCEDENHLQVTFEFIDSSSFASEKSTEAKQAIIDTVHSTSINSALNLINAYVGKEVNLSHCKVIVFSDKLAKRGIYSEVTELINNIHIRPSANIIICKGDAIEYIQKSTSDLEKVLTKYYDIFPNSSEYTGYTSNIMIGTFYNYLTTKDCGALAILGGLNPDISSSSSSKEGSSGSSSDGMSQDSEEKSSEDKPSNYISISEMISGNTPILGERGTENIGLAVLKDGKYVGDLTAADTLSHTLISGEVNSFLISIDDDEIYRNYIDISLFENTSPKISIDVSGDNPKIKIEIKLIGRIDGIKDEINYSDDSSNLDLNEISDAVNKYLDTILRAYLKKTTSDFKCDINYFYNYAKHNFLTIQEWNDYNWASRYETATFDISIESHVYYSLLNSD